MDPSCIISAEKTCHSDRFNHGPWGLLLTADEKTCHSDISNHGPQGPLLVQYIPAVYLSDTLVTDPSCILSAEETSHSDQRTPGSSRSHFLSIESKSRTPGSGLRWPYIRLLDISLLYLYQVLIHRPQRIPGSGLRWPYLRLLDISLLYLY